MEYLLKDSIIIQVPDNIMPHSKLNEIKMQFKPAKNWAYLHMVIISFSQKIMKTVN